MSSFRLTSCPCLFKIRQSVHTPQRRWARVHDIRFLATQSTQTRVTDRYRSKLNTKAAQEGHDGIEQLKDAYKERISDLRRKATIPEANAPLQTQVTRTFDAQDTTPYPHTPLSQPAHPASKLPPGVKSLSSFIDVSKMFDLPQREIEALWRLRHANVPHSLCAALPTSTYSNIARTAKEHPQFILPGLPPDTGEGVDKTEKSAKTGAAIHFMQWTFPSPETATVLFTHLAEYKLRGEHAQPHTTLTHHLELAEPKGLVLCQGNVVPDRGVTTDEGRWLLMQLQKFYNIGNDVEASDSSQVGKAMKKNRRLLVERFSHGSEEFRIEELLEEAERIG